MAQVREPGLDILSGVDFARARLAFHYIGPPPRLLANPFVAPIFQS
jgi:hypothetical protein